MALSKEEKAQLDALTKKSKEPDAPRGGLNFNLDLSDDKAYQRAVKLGLIDGDDDGDGDGDGDGDDDGDDTPKRRGFFPDS